MSKPLPDWSDRDDLIRLVHVMTVPNSLLHFLRGQMSFVKAHGVDVHAIASPSETLDRFSARDQVPVTAVPMARAMNPVQDIISLFRLYRVLRRLRPDIVQSGTTKAGMLGTLAGWFARTPIRIYHIRGLPLMTATGRQKSVLRWTERLTCRTAHRVFCVSHSVREYAIAEGLCSPDKIVVFKGGSGNGVDAFRRFNPSLVADSERGRVRSELGIPQDAPVIGYVGRLIGIKGIVELTAAWTSLRAKRPDVHLIAVGDIESHDPVPASVIRQLEDDPRVHLIGRVADTVPYYKAIDVLVFPTHREGLPNVLLEAAAMEVAAVATDVPGCIDVIHDGMTGTLVPLGDVAALEQATSAYLNDPELRNRHGRAARKWVLQDFQQEAIWEAVVREYGHLLQSHGRRIPVELIALCDRDDANGGAESRLGQPSAALG